MLYPQLQNNLMLPCHDLIASGGDENLYFINCFHKDEAHTFLTSNLKYKRRENYLQAVHREPQTWSTCYYPRCSNKRPVLLYAPLG